MHVDAPLSADIGSKAVRWIRNMYLALIFIVIGGMLAHNFIIWRAKAIARRKLEHRFVMRMPLRFRWQHAALLTSFILLVLTGFALKFPDSWFASMLSLGERMRHLLHRVAAVVLISVSIIHLFDLLLTREGRRLARDLFPTLDDVKGAWQNLSYYLGFSRIKPDFPRFNYAEKAEYWASGLGHVRDGRNRHHAVGESVRSAIICRAGGSTSRPPSTTMRRCWRRSRSSSGISTRYSSIPMFIPMNWAWWDGKMTLHHYQEEHGLGSESGYRDHRTTPNQAH